jgi:hypothetical protein
MVVNMDVSIVLYALPLPSLRRASNVAAGQRLLTGEGEGESLSNTTSHPLPVTPQRFAPSRAERTPTARRKSMSLAQSQSFKFSLGRCPGLNF